MRVHEPALFVASHQKEIATGHAFQKVSHVLAAHCSNRFVSNHVFCADYFGRAFGHHLADFFVVHQRSRLPHVIELVARTHRFANAADHSLDHLGNALMSFSVESSNRASKLRTAGNDVEGRARVETSDGDDCRIERRAVSAHYSLKRGDYLRGYDDGVDGLLRQRAVPSDTVD